MRYSTGFLAWALTAPFFIYFFYRLLTPLFEKGGVANERPHFKGRVAAVTPRGGRSSGHFGGFVLAAMLAAVSFDLQRRMLDLKAAF